MALWLASQSCDRPVRYMCDRGCFETGAVSGPRPMFPKQAVLLLQEQQTKTVKSAEKGRIVQPSLLRALYKAYGLPYLLLGFIKLVNDILNFAGPLLLNVLIRYLETPPDEDESLLVLGSHEMPLWRRWWPQLDSLAFGLLCAGLLGVTSLIKVGSVKFRQNALHVLLGSVADLRSRRG